jgi:CheY-like chemotaxis protein/two-component sensor histidine kinase
LKDEFLAVLSHELRTPLNAVLGYAHLLAAGTLSPERTTHALAAIERNAKAQARLVESLLDLSRVMAGKLELNLERVDLAAIVDAAVDVIRPEAEEKRITLDVLPSPDPIVLVGDAGRLQQVFWNLLSNAMKFTPAGGTISVAVHVQQKVVEVRVTDNGRGISPDFLPYVFDRFKHADSPKGRRSMGLGLGLALVREIVQGHGGTVGAESEGDGHGSSFRVTLPLALVPGDSVASAGAAPRNSFLASLPQLNVLIVDDDGDVRDVLTLLLVSHGATVRAVVSAAEALDAIHMVRPDVLLADIGMPEEDGYSLIRKIRAHERERNATRLPAIAVSAYATLADREQASTAGYDGHVSKPIDADVLTQAIAKVAALENA